MAKLTRGQIRELVKKISEAGNFPNDKEVMRFFQRNREELEKDSSLQNIRHLRQEESS